MTVTTRTGDKGVSYWKDKGVPKDDILISTIGCLDEVQAVIEMISIDLDNVKVDLWGIMGEIAYEKKYEELEGRIMNMEKEIDALEEKLPPLQKFMIFRKEKAAKLNWVRTLVRRAERRMVALARKRSLNPKLLAYINRLSDYLFMLARQEEEI